MTTNINAKTKRNGPVWNSVAEYLCKENLPTSLEYLVSTYRRKSQPAGGPRGITLCLSSLFSRRLLSCGRWLYSLAAPKPATCRSLPPKLLLSASPIENSSRSDLID